jgi:hypothetical protein
MEYLITAKEAMHKYGIREQQILEIVNSGKVTLYGRMGEILDADSEKELRDSLYYSFLDSAKRKEKEEALQMYDIDLPLDEIDTDPLLLSIVTEAANKDERLLVVGRYLFNTKEFENALRQMIETLIPINIPASLWAGKTPEAIFTVLSKEKFAPEVIAYIIMEKVGGISKTDTGRMFYQKEISKGIELDNRTYQRKIDDLLEEAKSKYLFTFTD